jgi:hypothetical protein
VKHDAADDLAIAIENNVMVFAPWLGVMAAAGLRMSIRKTKREI